MPPLVSQTELERQTGLLSAAKIVLARRNLNKAKSHPAEFRKLLLIEVNKSPVCYDSVLDDWQREDIEMLDDGWLRVVGRYTGSPDDDLVQRCYLERPRGHSKSTDVAIQVLYALVASERMILGYVCSGTIKQGEIIYNQLKKIVQLNPWLEQIIKIGTKTIKNMLTGSVCEILSSEENTSIGHTPDFIVIDELTHWPKKQLWDAVYSSAGKVPHCVVCIITNAGDDAPNGWHWKLREAVRQMNDPNGLRWHFRSLKEFVATWITQKFLTDQKLLLTDAGYRRYIRNMWIGKEDFPIPLAKIEEATCLPGPWKDLGPHPYHATIGGLDMGIIRDHSAWIVLGVNYESNKIDLLECVSWKPRQFTRIDPITKAEIHEIDPAVVEKHVIDSSKRWNLSGMVYDPSQCESIASAVRKAGFQAVRESFNAKSCTRMADDLIRGFIDSIFRMYRDEELLADLYKIEIKDNGIVRKIVAVSDEDTGHADRAVALAIAMPWALDTLKVLREKWLADQAAKSPGQQLQTAI